MRRRSKRYEREARKLAKEASRLEREAGYTDDDIAMLYVKRAGFVVAALACFAGAAAVGWRLFN